MKASLIALAIADILTKPDPASSTVTLTLRQPSANTPKIFRLQFSIHSHNKQTDPRES